MDEIEEEPRHDTAPEPEEDLSAAPYGYKKDGTPAKRRGRKPGFSPGKSSAPRRSGAASLESQIGAFLWTVNAPLQLIPPLQRDALDATEIQALAHAIDEECKRSPRFRKYVVQALSIQGGTSLFLVVGAIIGRRAIRHDIVPVPEEIGGKAGADALLGGVIAMSTKTGAMLDPNIFSMANAEANA